MESGVNQSQQHTTVCPGKRFRARACARTARKFNRGAMAGWCSPRWRPRQLAHHAHGIHCTAPRTADRCEHMVISSWPLLFCARVHGVLPPVLRATCLDARRRVRAAPAAACGCDPGPARATPISDFLLDWLYPWMIAMRYCRNGLPHIVSTRLVSCVHAYTRYHTSSQPSAYCFCFTATFPCSPRPAPLVRPCAPRF